MNGSLRKYIDDGLLNSEDYGEMMRELAQNTPKGVSRGDIDRDWDGIADGNFSPVREAWEHAT